jgi:hypothetical protein
MNGNYISQTTQENESPLHSLDMEIFSTGIWNGETYTEEDLQSMVDAFPLLANEVKPPIKLGHTDKHLSEGQPALGWIQNIRKVGNKLRASVSQVPDVVYKAIRAGLYKRVSAEIYWNYKRGGEVFKRVLAGVALLGADIPAVSNLADLEAYLTQTLSNPNYEKLISYSFDSNEQGEIITNNNKGDDEMTDETKTYQEQIETLKLENDEMAEKLKAAEATAEQAKTFKEELEAIRVTRSDEKKIEREVKFKDLCDKLVIDGKLPPAIRDLLTDFSKHSYSDDSGYNFSIDTIGEMLKVFDKVIISDEVGIGDGGKTVEYGSASAEVAEKAKAYMTTHSTADNKVAYSWAVREVLKEDEELALRYLSEGQRP